MKSRIELVLLLIIPPLLAQQRTGEGEFSVTGTVTNSLTGERIRNALVALEDPGDGSTQKAVLADAAGAFHFSGLAAGAYSVEASKPGYRDLTGPLKVTLGPSRDDLSLRLEPLAVIAGRILDSYGEPVANVLVHALQPRVEDGRRRLTMRRWARPDDRGDYRLWDLERGRYYVKVVGGSAAPLMYFGEIGPPQSDENFVPVYYGDSQTAATALAFNVGPGSQTRADFSLRLRPGHNITGTVVNAVPYRASKVELLSGDEDVGARALINAADGRFRIENVVDGAYSLRISQGEGDERTLAVETVQVAGRDVPNLRLRLAGGVSVKGTVRVEGGWPPGQRAYCNVALKAIEGPANPRASVDENWNFEISNVLPSRYRVTASLMGAYLGSITSGGRDLPDGELTVAPGVPPPPLEIQMRADGGEVTGSVTAENQPAGAVVALVPASPGRDVQIEIARNGRWSFRMVPPGEYRVHAWKEGVDVAYAEPEIRRALSGSGERLYVLPHGKHEAKLNALSEEPR